MVFREDCEKVEFVHRCRARVASGATSNGLHNTSSAKILSMDETQINNEYSMVKVHWGVTFKKTGNKLIEFDVTYFIQKTGPEPKIIMFIAHQDEERAMKELGLLG